LKEKVADAAEQARAGVGEGLGAIRSRAAAAISDTTESARAAASDTVTAAAEAVSGTYRSGIVAASRTGDQLSESFRQSKENFFETMERHPFLVGGVGLLIGALIASALPVSQTENRLFGDTSDDLKNRARGMASEGLEVAKTTVQDIYRLTRTTGRSKSGGGSEDRQGCGRQGQERRAAGGRCFGRRQRQLACGFRRPFHIRQQYWRSA